MRIRGAITCTIGEAPATGVIDHTVAVWGIYVANRTLWGAAASGHPDPLSTDTIEAYTDWMGYGATHLVVAEATASPPPSTGAYDGKGVHTWDVDVRARRKLDEMNSVLSLNFNSTPEGTFWDYHLSVLVALP